MKVMITRPPGIFAEGILQSIVSEQEEPVQIVINMNVAGVSEPVEVMLGELDLSTIVRLARGSKVQKIRNAVS